MWLNGDLLGSQNNFHSQFSWRVTFISSAILIFHIRLPVYSLDLWEVCSGRGRGGLGGNWLEMLKMASETCFPLDYADFSQLLHSFLRIIISGWKITLYIKILIILRLWQEIQYVAIANKRIKQTCMKYLNYIIKRIYYLTNIGYQCVNNNNNVFQFC